MLLYFYILSMSNHSIIIFASGRGSNAQAIIDYFRNDDQINIELIVSNKADAGVLSIAERENIASTLVDRDSFGGDEFCDKLKIHNPSLIVLAGFLWKIPSNIVAAFPNKIVNIHPALLPKHGGKGMYGHHVHKAVLHANETASGITIHYVNDIYDAGNKILQAHCPVRAEDDVDSLANRIHKLEHFFLPRTIAYLLEHS